MLTETRGVCNAELGVRFPPPPLVACFDVPLSERAGAGSTPQAECFGLGPTVISTVERLGSLSMSAHSKSGADDMTQ